MIGGNGNGPQISHHAYQKRDATAEKLKHGVKK
jgi:hypothetical protein